MRNKPKENLDNLTDEQLIKRYNNLVKRLEQYSDELYFISPNKESYTDIIKRLDNVYNKLSSMGIPVKPFHVRRLK